MALNLPACPTSLKPIQHYLKTATEHEARDPVVAYWSRLLALQNGMTLDKSSKESLAVLLPLMDWLESTKSTMKENEAITNEVVASAHIENYAMKLFLWADKEDRAGVFNKNVVKAFYTSGMLFDVLSVFGEITPEVAHHRKYAKWKAAYIHNCLKNGETPIPGPMATGEEEEEDATGESQPGPAPVAPFSQPYDPASGAIPAPAAQPIPTPSLPTQTVHPAYPPAPAAHLTPQPMPAAPQASTNVKLSLEQISRAQKLCKFAISSLDYEDLPAAIDNLNKALFLCQNGREMS